MLKEVKQGTLSSLKSSGLLRLVHNSKWRRRRLLILAYHGISISDEHLWNNSNFISADLFRQRLQLLKKLRCAVLPLDEAITRLYANDLPDRAVAITFDDGTVDFYRKAFPAFKEFDFPVTLYLTTFYSEYQKPIFDLMCSYLLWKGREEVVDLKELAGAGLKMELRTSVSRAAAASAIREFASEQKLSADEKDAVAASLASQLKVDYDALLEARTLHCLRPDEVKQLATAGVDVQLHTHRHRTPRDRELFIRELDDNRKRIYEMTGREAVHFCYPSGVHHPEFLPWLKEAGVVSATTCDTGLASLDSDPLLLPRLLDVSSLSALEFEGWLTGVSAALPRRYERKGDAGASSSSRRDARASI
jgi:peptidoglycan/xylan/chitin deacetylase (PgdA/CDA1 family)